MKQITFRRLALLVCAAFGIGAGYNAAAQGVTADEIVIGQTAALTGPLGELGTESSTSAKAYFDYINQQGGINGRKIRFIALDDGYNPERAVANVKQLIEKDKALSLFGVLGTPANIAIMPIITQAGIPNFGPYTGSDAARGFNRLVFHTSAGYTDEITKIIEHFGVRGITRIATVYQNNAFGKEGLAAVERVMAANNLKLSASAAIESSGADADKAAAIIAPAAPQAIVMITAGKASIDFIKTYNQKVLGVQYFALSVMASQGAINALGKDGVGVVVSQVVPLPFSATSSIVQEYQRVMNKMGIKKWSFSSMGGFINAKFMVEGLRRTGRDLTRERFINTLETMGKIDLDGNAVHYSKSSHLASPYVELTVISKEGRFLR